MEEYIHQKHLLIIGVEMNLDDFSDDRIIYVIDTETTGLEGHPRDVVVDMGICSVNMALGKVNDIYSSVVGHDISGWSDAMRHAWIFENTDLTLEMVSNAPSISKVVKDVECILKGRNVTSFNVAFDMDKFLYNSPWNMKGTFNLMPDIMIVAKDVCKIPSPYYERKYAFPKLNVAYDMIVMGDPAGVGGIQDHRALSDARMASYLMLQMHRNGDYVF